MTEEQTMYCPLCGRNVKMDSGKCPVCGAKIDVIIARRELEKVIEKRIALKMRDTPQEGILQGAEVQKTALSEMKPKCPACASELSGGESKCPRCGIALGGATEDQLECPECGHRTAMGTKVCPVCGVTFVETPEPLFAIPEKAIPPTPPSAPAEAPTEGVVTHIAKERPGEGVPATAPEGPTQRGIVNGTGAARRPGFVNGTGLVNGTSAASRGAINGTGLVNGSGRINGTGQSVGHAAQRRSADRVLRRWQFLAVLALIIIILPTFMFLSAWHKEAPAVDGNFKDWAHVEKYGMTENASLAELSVSSWGVQTVGEKLFMYVMTEGTMMSSSGVDSFYLFVDSDNSSSTGYLVSGIGADYALVLNGWNGSVQSASLMTFTSANDQLNWTGWTQTGSLEFALKENRLEAMASLPSAVGSDAKYILLAQNNVPNRVSSVSYPVSATGGVLIVSQEPGTGIVEANGTVPSATGVVLLHLVLSCQGRGGTVESIYPTVSGATPSSYPSGISMTPGEDKIEDIQVDTTHSLTASLVSAFVAKGNVKSTFSEVVVVGDQVTAYARSPPSTIVIDGSFGDWMGKTRPVTGAPTVLNPNIDLTAVGAVNSSASVYFFASVQGQMCQGAYAPEVRAKPSIMSNATGVVVPHRKTGQDFLRIYIDSDKSNATGLMMGATGKVIGADYLVEIRGLNGRIVGESVSRYSSGVWVPAAWTGQAAKDAQDIELSVPSTSIGGSTSVDAIIQTTDWRDLSDSAWVATVPDPWVVTSTGGTYTSDTGAIWNYVGAPTLEPGDYVVDVAVDPTGADVYAVTNSGRVYDWTIGSSSSWSANVSNVINGTANAVAFTMYSKSGAYLLCADGRDFWTNNLGGGQKKWTMYAHKVADGVSDFDDFVYSKTGNSVYAIRAGTNTQLSYSANGGSSWGTPTSATGSTSPQTHLCVIGGAVRASDRLFVLCQNGDIRYSSDGGTTWSDLGNLPRPQGANTSKYVAMGIDSAGYLWVTTDTGYCYKSTDTTTYSSFVYAGHAPATGIAALVPIASIPEFPEIPMAALTALILLSLDRGFARKRRTPKGSP